MNVGDKILGIVTLAVMGAILGDALVHYQGTSVFFNGLSGLLGQTYKAAAGGYSA
jgi:hypothetical protein